jgi:hypothetical protein
MEEGRPTLTHDFTESRGTPPTTSSISLSSINFNLLLKCLQGHYTRGILPSPNIILGRFFEE